MFDILAFRSPDSALQSGLEKPKFTPSGPQLWKGFIQMQDVAKFVTTAYPVSGLADKLVSAACHGPPVNYNVPFITVKIFAVVVKN